MNLVEIRPWWKSITAEEHKAHLQKIFQVLSDELIYLQIPKSHVFCKYVRYLGAIAGNDMLLEDPDKVRAIVKMPMPRNSQTEIRGFLGMRSALYDWLPKIEHWPANFSR